MKRRAVLGAMAASGLSLTLPPAALARPRRFAPHLRLGDTVALVAPASAVSEGELANAEHMIRGMGLVPRIGRNVMARAGYLAGTDAQRAADLDAAFADPAIRAIFAVRGGWGGARILRMLDWDAIRRNPKLFVGYSDNTALHLALAGTGGFASLHAPNAGGPWPKESWESLWRLAFTGETPVLGGAAAEPGLPDGPQGQTLVPGIARGRLLGGNLTVLSTLMGTPFLPRFERAILFLEDVNEAEYRVDRMLQQLRLAGVLEQLSGVVFGRCRSCSTTEEDYRGFSLDEVLAHHLGGLGIPAFVGANIGHHRGQLTLPHGAEVEIDASARTIRVLSPIVA